MLALSFEPDRSYGIALCIDGEPRLREPLVEREGQLFARLLQGWMPQNLGLERANWVPDGPERFGWVPIVRTSVVLVTLPGGIRPEIDFEMCEPLLAEAHGGTSGVAVLGLDEGRAVLVADITFNRSGVFWNITFGQHAGETWEFTRAQYDAAIRDLLTLLGEEPVLISPEEWAAPTPTRVVPA